MKGARDLAGGRDTERAVSPDAKEKEFEGFPADLKLKMQTSVTRIVGESEVRDHEGLPVEKRKIHQDWSQRADQIEVSSETEISVATGAIRSEFFTARVHSGLVRKSR